MFVTAIIAAGGRGVRFGGNRPKQLVKIGAVSMLERSVTAFVDHPEIDEVIVALPAELAADPPEFVSGSKKPVRVVVGGARRQDSVQNGVQAASAATDVIVVHDAARPFVSAELIARTIAAAAETGAAVAAIPTRDTVKRTTAGATGAHGPAKAGPHVRVVAQTLPRDQIYLAQTPQAFRREVLDAALALDVEATDEAALAEWAGFSVQIVEGEARNIKVTSPEDLTIAEAIAAESGGVRGTARSGSAPVRIGTGYDLHRLVEGRPLILGGVTIPFDRGLAGHSDADAVCHAVTDAVLGAAAAGDIGRHFPDTDPQWKGASSIDLLQRAALIVRTGGWTVSNVDVVIIAERPKVGPFVDAMRVRLASALGIDVSAIGIKGKTNEGVGELGRAEAIAVHAVALLSHVHHLRD